MCSIEICYLGYIQHVLRKSYAILYILCKFYPVRSNDYTWKLNLVLLFSHFLVNIIMITVNIGKVVSMRLSQRWNNACEHTLTQLSLSTKCKSWNKVGSSTLNRRNSFNVVSTLFRQCWNNFNKHMPAQLLFSTKFERWNNVGLSALNRRNSINLVSTLFCQCWNNIDKCTSAQLSFSSKY